MSGSISQFKIGYDIAWLENRKENERTQVERCREGGYRTACELQVKLILTKLKLLIGYVRPLLLLL